MLLQKPLVETSEALPDNTVAVAESRRDLKRPLFSKKA
jgi:hypothetical protein